LGIPIAAVIGIPMYIRAETISTVLMGKGMGVGAVVALIIGGAGVSIPEISLLAAIFRKKLVAVLLMVAVLAGFLANLLTSFSFNYRSWYTQKLVRHLMINFTWTKTAYPLMRKLMPAISIVPSIIYGKMRSGTLLRIRLPKNVPSIITAPIAIPIRSLRRPISA
jgi:flagellar biosynthesis protein FliQ